MAHRFLSSVAVAGALSAALAMPASAATLFFDNFDDDFRAQGISAGTAVLINWNVTRGAIDVLGPGMFNFYPGNGNYLDMDGSSQAAGAGRIETKTVFPLLVGQTYRLSFLYGRNGPATETMGFGLTGNYSSSFTLDAATPTPQTLQPFSVDFAATMTSGNIFFDHAGADFDGLIIDNVRLESIDRTAVVPLPAGLPLMVGGLAGLAIAARRRKG